jgi:acetylornithine/N-succinyldiaminopimelate aminotransferase
VTNLDVVNAGYDVNLLTVPGGDNVVRLLPSLIVTDAEIAEAVRRLDQAATALEVRSHAAAE